MRERGAVLKPTRYELQVSIRGHWVKIGAWSGHLASSSLPSTYEGSDAVEWAGDLDAPLARDHLRIDEVETDAIDGR
jgi:hypothetical protein